MSNSASDSQVQSHIFRDQLIFQLRDVPIMKINDELNPEGQLIVHIPSGPLQVGFNKRETVDHIRNRVLSLSGFDTTPYYVVSDHGILNEDSTLDSHYIRNGSHILLVKKGIKDEFKLLNRKIWLKSRQRRLIQSQSGIITTISSKRSKSKANNTSHLGTLHAIKK